LTCVIDDENDLEQLAQVMEKKVKRDLSVTLGIKPIIPIKTRGIKK